MGKDVTSTSFGLLIAFLLPGLVGVWGLSYWSTAVRDVLSTFVTSQSNVGLFLLVLLAGLAMGLVATVLRYYVFECWLCRRHRIDHGLFAKLGDEERLTAYRAAVDEHYRYHQFWGGLVAIAPVGFFGWLRNSWGERSWLQIATCLAAFALFEVVIGHAASKAFENYGTRAKSIMKGE